MLLVKHKNIYKGIHRPMDLYEKQFKIRKEDAIYWWNKSTELYLSASILWKDVESNKISRCWDTYKMLMGMSFELMFKAHCVIAKEFNFAGKNGHDLNWLAQKSRLLTSKQDKRILDILSEYIRWDGRYPTPLQPDFLKKHWDNQSNAGDPNKSPFDTQKNEKIVPLTSERDELDLENLSRIWKRFSDVFHSNYTPQSIDEILRPETD
jgi:hypothetical protein